MGGGAPMAATGGSAGDLDNAIVLPSGGFVLCWHMLLDPVHCALSKILWHQCYDICNISSCIMG